MVFCRLPWLLLHSDCPATQAKLLLPPLNQDPAAGFTGRQPVLYLDVQCTSNPEAHHAIPRGVRFPGVEVDWWSMRIVAYEDEDDLLNRLPSHTSLFIIQAPAAPATLWSKPPATAWDYALRVEALVRRGHHLGHASCRCSMEESRLDYERAAELGLNLRTRTHARCQVGRIQEVFSELEITRELGLLQPFSFIDSGGTRLDLLLIEMQQHGMFQCVRGADGRMCGLRAKYTVLNIRCEASLVSACEAAWPFPIPLPDPHSSYPGVERDARRLHAARRCIMMPQGAEDGQPRLFHRPDLEGGDVDPDIAAIWHASTPSKSEVHAAGLHNERLRWQQEQQAPKSNKKRKRP